MNTIKKATGNSPLAPLKYTGEKCTTISPDWELCSAHLASMDDPINEGLLMRMSTKSVFERSKSPYMEILLAFLTNEELTWKPRSSQIMHEYDVPQSLKSMTELGEVSAFVATL